MTAGDNGAAPPPRTPGEQSEVEAQLAVLARAYEGLPERRRGRCQVPVTGDPARDILVLAEAGDWSGSYEGVVVAGSRGADGRWDLDAEFTLFTTDDRDEGSLVVVKGYFCHVDIL